MSLGGSSWRLAVRLPPRSQADVALIRSPHMSPCRLVSEGHRLRTAVQSSSQSPPGLGVGHVLLVRVAGIPGSHRFRWCTWLPGAGLQPVRTDPLRCSRRLPCTPACRRAWSALPRGSQWLGFHAQVFFSPLLTPDVHPLLDVTLALSPCQV